MLRSKINFMNKTITGKIYDNDSLIVSYKIQYPQFLSISFSDQLSRINMYYREKANQFQNYCETELYHRAVAHFDYSINTGAPVITYQGILTYTPTYNKNCTASLYFDEYFFEGGAHGRTTRSADTWNLDDGNEYPLSAFFAPDADYRKYITDAIINQINTQITNGHSDYFDDYENLVVERFDQRNFYLTEAGIDIFYQEYDIGPYSTGIPVFTIPYEENVVMEPKCSQT